VDHPLAAPDALVRPWRTAALVAAAIAAVELVLLLVIGGGAVAGIVSKEVQQAATRRALATPAPEKERQVTRQPASAAAKVLRTKLRVVVLNGNGRQGAAAAAASRVHRRGYKIGFVGNAPSTDFGKSIVMYRPGFAGEGRRFGRDLGVKLVTPLDGIRLSQLHGSHLVLILGR
jgi:hypothetical protein